jgi:hypothetical protein
MKDKEKAIQCKKCEGVQLENNFYKPLKKNRICKDCLCKEFIFQYNGIYDNDFGATIEWMCKEYNLPFVQELIYYHENVLNIKDKLECYMNDISLLPMYQNKIITKEKSDIDFINEDIKGVKEHIEYSLKQHDFNSHNKWLNSLRDALELREKLQGNNNNTFNIKIHEIRTDSFDEIIQAIQQSQANQIGNSFNKTSIDIDHKDGVSYISEHILQSLRNSYEIKYGRKSYNEPVYMMLTDRKSKEEINIIINKNSK